MKLFPTEEPPAAVWSALLLIGSPASAFLFKIKLTQWKRCHFCEETLYHYFQSRNRQQHRLKQKFTQLQYVCSKKSTETPSMRDNWYQTGGEENNQFEFHPRIRKRVKQPFVRRSQTESRWTAAAAAVVTGTGLHGTALPPCFHLLLHCIAPLLVLLFLLVLLIFTASDIYNAA